MPLPTPCFLHTAKKSARWIFIMVLMMANACTSATSIGVQPTNTDSANQTIFFPQQETVEGERETMTAEATGILVLVDGCIRLNHDESETSWLLIWPPGFSLRTVSNSVQIRDENGEVAARVGEPVWVSGGEAESASFFNETMKQKLPADCPAPYWIVGDEVRVIDALQ